MVRRAISQRSREKIGDCEQSRFLSWIGTYCISCVVQQRSRVKDVCFLVGYDESELCEIRLVKSIKGVQSLVEEICKITQSIS